MPPYRSGSTNSCPKDSDAESELIDMTSNDSNDSFDSFPLKPCDHYKDNNVKISEQINSREEESSQLESPKDVQQTSSVSSPVKQMVQQFNSDLSTASFGALALPNLAMNMFMPTNNSTVAGTAPTGPFLDSLASGDHLLASHSHHHYLNALHQQQQQFLFNSSLKLGITDHHHTASAFRKVK